jgi:hypothetical protein
MAGTLQELLAAAEQEWVHWGRSTWNVATGATAIGHTDDETPFAQHVIDVYNKVGGGNPTLDQIANDLYFWSAVGMSAIFAAAGFSKAEFPFAQAHAKWLVRFIKARKDNSPALYHGFRLHEPQASPQVGDLVAYTRGKMTFNAAQKFYDKTGNYSSHSDLVVARRASEIDVLGFNVLDSVTKKTIALDANGLIGDRTHNWFTVLRRLGFD